MGRGPLMPSFLAVPLLILAACMSGAPDQPLMLTTTTTTPAPIPTLERALLEEPPRGPGAEIGKRYPYELYTHCGLRWAYFNGRWWEASPPLDDGSGNPPRGWGNPSDAGTMELVSQGLARFTGGTGQTAEFKPLPVGIQEIPGRPCA